MARFGALAVGAGIFLSRVAGLVRERVFAHYFGSLPIAGAFKAALRIPNLLQNLFGEGVLSASFIPVYARLLSEKRYDDARRVASAVGSLLFLVVTLLVAIGVTFSGPLTYLIAPGYKGEIHELTTHIVRVMFFGVGLLVWSAWCLGVLNSHRKFFLSYAAPVLWNAAQIAALVYFGRRLVAGREDDFAVTVAWSTVVGAGVQLATQLPFALRLAGSVHPSLKLGDTGKLVLSNFLPVLAARGVVQISAYIDQILATYLGTAMVANMFYAQQLYTLPVSLFGMAVAASELAEMSHDSARLETVRLRLERAAERLAFFVVPSVVAFAGLGDVISRALYETGKFTTQDAMDVWVILLGSTVGLLAATQGRLLSSCFQALGDTRTPARIAILRMVLTGGLGWFIAMPLRGWLGFSPVWGAAGLTASAGLAAWLEMLLLRQYLQKKIGRFSLGGRWLVLGWLAAILAGGAAFAVHRYWPIARPIPSAIVVLGVYGTVYGFLALAFRLPLAMSLWKRFRG
jgi:putative peptidoglycan lipid II flippase